MTGRATAKDPSPVRCAIYTRKSTEEGLEQEFNSLDAQREAGEAFIASQRAEGWVCLPHRYDDGGFSGGNVERPALRRLMADIEAGEVDCVVVYKVDRLSRSLMDFSRLMATFDDKRVSFVSVTQQFNTTHSMGRLTLNILLSFAQFEREIISERTRDKITAARRKGKWAGGRPILGYDLISRPGGGRLDVNPQEAKQVRSVFALYLELGSLMPVVEACAVRGWTTKKWTTRAGRPMGGRAMDKGAVFALLTNPAYIGKIRHHKEIFEGEHDGIVDPDIFEKVQKRLRLNGRTGGSRIRNKYDALLKGIVRCASCACPMRHHCVSQKRKHGTIRHRYYVCQKAQKQGWKTCPGPSLPADDLESFVLERVRDAVTSDNAVDAVAERAVSILSSVRPDLVVDPDEVVGAAESFDPVWDAMTARERESVMRELIEVISWDPEHESVSITFREGVLEEEEAIA